MSSEERVDIRLIIRQQRIQDVRIQIKRNVGLVKVFENKPVSEVRRTLPTFFSLCGQAQSAAVTAACAMAQRQKVPTMNVSTEIIAEHGLSLVRDWFPPEQIILAKPFRAVLKNGIAAEPEAKQALDALLQAPAEVVLQDLNYFLRWRDSSASHLARIMRRWQAEGTENFGHCRFSPLATLPPPSVLRKVLLGDGTASLVFCAEPEGGFETGPLARRCHHPLIEALLEQHGNGLLTRMVARLVELYTLLHTHQPRKYLIPPPISADDFDNGSGIGVVEAARGLLLHLVVLDYTLVHRYRIIAPTAWNFHPRGVLYQGLMNRPAPPRITSYVRMLVNALDPCVAAYVNVEDDNSA